MIETHVLATAMKEQLLFIEFKQRNNSLWFEQMLW